MAVMTAAAISVGQAGSAERAKRTAPTPRIHNEAKSGISCVTRS